MLLAMHIPDGFLGPAATIATWGLAVGGVGYSLWRLRAALGARLAPLIGVTSAGIFAGQMVNFPLVGLATSGHLMGGVLAAVVLGPWGAVVALSTVLIVQCFMFGDGGVTALGANITNMALVGGLLGYTIYAPLRRLLGGGTRGTVLAAVVASWLIIPVAALAFVLEFAAGGTVGIFPLATWMVFYHVLIGLGEAIVTGLVVSWLMSTRPDLIYDPRHAVGRVGQWGQAVAAALVAAVAIAVFLAPWASEHEDGLERVADSLGFANRAEASAWAPFPDYALPSNNAETIEADKSAPANSFVPHAGMVTSLMGLVGTLATFGFAVIVARTAERRGSTLRPDAAAGVP
ncbi:MAG TPA: energy-coupling factor ABC transporter permease [Pirellulales bacterium]|jgi:cobalt/nickel transport system permease protein|nr:energy-coupling factor ABC transporter permease [Pirellulales bacterium]